MSKKPAKNTASSRKSGFFSPFLSATIIYLFSAISVIAACLTVTGVWANDFSAMPWDQMIPIGIYLVGFPMILIGLKIVGWRGDAAIIGAVMMLSGMGLVIQLRMGSFARGLEAPLALLPFPLGLSAFLLAATLTSKGRGAWTRILCWVLYLTALGAMAAMLVLGQRYRGGFYLPGNINPSEIVKPLLVFFLAAYLSRRKNEFSEPTTSGIPMPPITTLLGLTILWSIPMLFTVLLHDLGLAGLLSAILMVMLFAVSKRTGYLAIGLVIVLAGCFGMQLISANAQSRFDIWLNPFSDATGKGWQTLQALSAMYSGGLWGSGLGAGLPNTVPIVSSDFVYAAIAEEMGLVGCALLLLVFLILFSRGFRASAAARTPYERLLCIGLTASLAVQTLFNIGGVTKALPMTGITLPFVSHGGSSLITSLFIAGLICGLSDSEK